MLLKSDSQSVVLKVVGPSSNSSWQDETVQKKRQRCRDGALYMYLPSLFIIPTLFVYFLVCHIPTFFTFLMFYSLVHTDNNLTTK